MNYLQWCEENRDIRFLIKELRSSLPEQYIGYYLATTLSTPIEYSKSFDWLGKRSLDIFLPRLSLAIEYDGIRYHGDKSYEDEEKSILCQQHRITLIRIREDRLPPVRNRTDIVIHYSNNSKYSNIADVINVLIRYIPFPYIKTDFIDVNIKRDSEAIISYVQNKYHCRTMAYNWPEIFSYWHEEMPDTPYDYFCTTNYPIRLRCPHCGSEYIMHTRYYHERKSLIPCKCEYPHIETLLDSAKQDYRKTHALPLFNDTLDSRRLYDRIVSDIRFWCNDPIDWSMYKALGFQLPPRARF